MSDSNLSLALTFKYVFNIRQSGVLTAPFGCCVAGAM